MLIYLEIKQCISESSIHLARPKR